MAKIKFTAFLADMRGKVNGTVFSKNRGGAYARTKVSPINGQTAAQTLVRSALTALSQQFRALGAAIIEAWNNAVSEFKTTDVFGDIKTPSGINLFNRLNLNLSKVGIAPITSPPAPINVPPLTGLGLSIDVSDTEMEITADQATSGADTRMFIEATAPQSPGKSFVKSEFRKIAAGSTNEALPKDVWAEYVTKFGAPAVGKKVFIRIRTVSTTTGLESLPQVISAIVAA